MGAIDAGFNCILFFLAYSQMPDAQFVASGINVRYPKVESWVIFPTSDAATRRPNDWKNEPIVTPVNVERTEEERVEGDGEYCEKVTGKKYIPSTDLNMRSVKFFCSILNSNDPIIDSRFSSNRISFDFYNVSNDTIMRQGRICYSYFWQLCKRNI